MTTEVSISPRPTASATGCRALVDVAVEIGSESVTVEVGSAGEDFGDLFASKRTVAA